MLAASLNPQGAAIRANNTGTQVPSATNLLGDISETLSEIRVHRGQMKMQSVAPTFRR